jgi:hypothetical protein
MQVKGGRFAAACRRAAPRAGPDGRGRPRTQSSASADPGGTPPPGTAAALRVTPDRRVPGVMLAVTHKTAVPGAELKEKPCRTETLAEHVVTLLQCNTKGGHPMAVRTKPLRIFETDHAPLRLLAELERRSPQEVVHSALAEYLDGHRDQLAAVFTETQRAIAAGDLDALTAQLAASAEAQADALLETLPTGN